VGDKYRSVIGFGKVLFVDGVEEKRKALDMIVAHYGGESCDYPEATLEGTAVVKVEIESLTAKVSGY
jgi:nitroimidazol reductase NimA-like FMN-containing flavoprotein (pyridoxamine 5'-phosphate oxidase superfamily)